MQYCRALSRSVLLALTMLSACAAADPPGAAGPAAGEGRSTPPTGVYADFLTGTFALSQMDLGRAATDFLRASQADPLNAALMQQAFMASVMAGSPEALKLAHDLPESIAAQLLMADEAARKGDWAKAEAMYHALPQQGLTQLLQPLLVAWSQQGLGRTDTALATLRPLVDGNRFRGVYALHAAMIADLAGRDADAARLYRIAQAEMGQGNLRLAQIIASWQARSGHAAQAADTLRALAPDGGDIAMALPGLIANVSARPVATPADGIAEAYIALAAALRQQDATDFSLLLLRLALGLRPDFTAAKLLLADVVDGGKHPHAAELALAGVSPNDPLSPLVRLKLAELQARQDHIDAALADLEKLSRDFPARAEPYALMGDILRAKSRFADAVTAYDKAVARIPVPVRADWPLFYDRGIALDRSGHWDLAQADFNTALKLMPDQPYVLNYLGYSWTERGEHLTEARKMIERAVEQRPNDGAIIDSLGWIMLRQGDIAGAVRTLEKAVELQPEDPTINGHLGDAYWRAGRQLEARYQWSRALSLKPDPEDVPKLEQKLRDGLSSQTQGGAATQAAAKRPAAVR